MRRVVTGEDELGRADARHHRHGLAEPEYQAGDERDQGEDDDAEHAGRHEGHADEQQTVGGIAVARPGGEADGQTQSQRRVAKDTADKSAPDGGHSAGDRRRTDDVRGPRGHALRDHQYRLSLR